MSENVVNFGEKENRDAIDTIVGYLNGLHEGGVIVGLAVTIVTRDGAVHNASAALMGHAHRVHAGVHRNAVKMATEYD